MLADAGTEVISLPATGPTVDDSSLFHLRLDVYNLTVDAG